MRRSDKEITLFEEKLEVMRECDACILAMNNGEYPYVVPVNYGVLYEDNKLYLYIHGANEGTKIDLLGEGKKVSFEMDHCHKLIERDILCQYTMEYESVIGNGMAEIVEGDEKKKGLNVIMKHYMSGEHKMEYNEELFSRTVVIKVTVNEITGKRHFVKK